MKINPFKADAAEKNPKVETVIRTRSGSTVNVDYVLHKTSSGEW